MKNKYLIAVAICIMLGTIGIGSAHQTWIYMNDSCVNLNDTIDVNITVGHDLIPELVPSGNVFVEIVSPDGSITSLNKTHETNNSWCSSFKADQLGSYALLGNQGRDNFSARIYTGPGSRDDYPDYPYIWISQAGPINWTEINKSRWADDWHVVRYTKSHQYLKTFVSTDTNCVFSGLNSAYGQPLEIIPVDDLSTIGTGDFKFEVLWNGNALPNGTIKLRATNAIDNYTRSAICDDSGSAVLPLNVTCDCWLITAGANDSSDYWHGAHVDIFPHGDNYTGQETTFVGYTYSAALTLLV